jgi:hypothetical protein
MLSLDWDDELRVNIRPIPPSKGREQEARLLPWHRELSTIPPACILSQPQRSQAVLRAHLLSHLSPHCWGYSICPGCPHLVFCLGQYILEFYIFMTIKIRNSALRTFSHVLHFIFCSTGDWIQGLILARQGLLCYTPSYPIFYNEKFRKCLCIFLPLLFFFSGRRQWQNVNRGLEYFAQYDLICK